MAGEVLIDANVFMYAAGAAHPYRSACRAIVRLLAAEAMLFGRRACVDAELFQEVAYRYASIRRPRTGQEMQRALLALGLRVLPVDDAVVGQFVELQQRFEEELEGRRVSVRALLHLAVMRAFGIVHIVSADRDFEALGVERLDPVAVASRTARDQ